jgi:hypothetical protein
LYSSLSSAPEIQRPWIISLMILHSLANVAAAAGIFFWKKVGTVYLYSFYNRCPGSRLDFGWRLVSVLYGITAAIVGWVLRS